MKGLELQNKHLISKVLKEEIKSIKEQLNSGYACNRNDVMSEASTTQERKYFYRPQQKLREANVFTGVCHSVHRGQA